ncbi:hypothetical protein CVT24_006147 [Panaeolus cyanescens]|uniref:F-box domain-containing protein n=1 Tax=Panaeolus cyanescens TaxID=181874 RepID=A0A409VZV2_9AGAR|nr:hypothetical protein CVT24_006147 [Panaeolus cyanescens]
MSTEPTTIQPQPNTLSPALPYDILFLLISELDVKEDKQTLAAWARTASSFRDAAQARLYSAVTVVFQLIKGEMMDNVPSTEKFFQSMARAPRLAEYVRHLDVALRSPTAAERAAMESVVVTIGFPMRNLLRRLVNLIEYSITVMPSHHFQLFNRTETLDGYNKLKPKRVTITGLIHFPLQLIPIWCAGLRSLEIPCTVATLPDVKFESLKRMDLESLTISPPSAGLWDATHEIKELLKTIRKLEYSLNLSHLKELHINAKLLSVDLSGILSMCSNALTHLTFNAPYEALFCSSMLGLPTSKIHDVCPIVDLGRFTNLSQLVINGPIARGYMGTQPRFSGSFSKHVWGMASSGCLPWVGAVLNTLALTRPTIGLSCLCLNLHIPHVQLSTGEIPWIDIVDPLLRLKHHFRRIEIVISFKDRFVPFPTHSSWSTYLESNAQLKKLGTDVVKLKKLDRIVAL